MPSANTKNKKSPSFNKNPETNNNSKEIKFSINPKIKMNLISTKNKKISKLTLKLQKAEKSTSAECPK